MNRAMTLNSERFAVIISAFLVFLVMPSQGYSEEADARDNIAQVEKTVNIRKGRTITSEATGKLYPGGNFKVGFLYRNWYAVFTLDQKADNESEALGYVYAPYLKLLAKARIMFTDRVVNIRRGRTTESPKAGKLYAGARVKAAFLQDSWYAVFDVDEMNIDEANAMGYVYFPLLIEEGSSTGENSEKPAETAGKRCRNSVCGSGQSGGARSCKGGETWH